MANSDFSGCNGSTIPVLLHDNHRVIVNKLLRSKPSGGHLVKKQLLIVISASNSTMKRFPRFHRKQPARCPGLYGRLDFYLGWM
jgi:hypothetical protein